jgi:hypothetical protein
MFCLEEQPCHLRYEVYCDTSWRTRSVTVIRWIGRDPGKLAIVAMPGERWNVHGAEQTGVAGCVDVDRGFTPVTTLIPRRRLALSVGDTSDAPAAWRRFPALVLERLEPQ